MNTISTMKPVYLETGSFDGIFIMEFEFSTWINESLTIKKKIRPDFNHFETGSFATILIIKIGILQLKKMQ